MPALRTLLVLEFGGTVCALPLEAVREVVPMARLVRPPGLLSFVEGFLNLRGTALPVLRLDVLFWLPRKAPELYNLLVVLQGSECSLALLADHVHQITFAPAQAFRALSQHHCFNDCAEAEVTLTQVRHGNGHN
jgi:purine-binding chemotaxis protein CheW